MRVLHVFKSYFPDTFGGIEQVIAQLSAGLAEFGVESRIFTVSPEAQPAVVQRPEGDVHRFRTTIDVASNPVSLPAFLAYRKHVAWADVVHYQFPWPFADLLHLAWARHKPSVLSYQSDIVRQKVLLRAYAPLMHLFLRSVDRVVATSPQYLDTSTVLQGLPGPVPVIPNGVDETRFPEPSPQRLAHWRERVGEDFFLFVGVLRYYKGLDTLLQAAEGFAGRVVIVGSGPEEPNLRQHAQSLQLANVSFLGTVDDQDKMCLLRLARAFVFPSHLRSEAFGMSLVEAAMCGKPLVSCSIGTGTSFVNEDGITGWTVPPGDHEALRAAMERLRADAQLAGAFGAAARRRFEELFTARRMAQAYYELYRSLLATSPPAPPRPR